MGALELARAFGFDEVELPDPPGFGARVRRVEVEELVRTQRLPRDLRDRVLREGGKIASSAPYPEEVTPEEVTPKMVELSTDLIEWQVASLVRALRPTPDADWEPVTLTPDVFAELPWRTQAALRDIAMGRKTPAMVTAMVRRMRGEISEDEALAVVSAERGKLTEGWSTFRDERRRARTGAGSGEVAPQPVELPAESGSDRGTRARRRARPAADPVGGGAGDAASAGGPR